MNKVSVIFISILIFLVFLAPTSIFIPNPTTNGHIKNLIYLFLLIYTSPDFVKIFIKKYRKYNILLIAYCLVIIFSVYYNIDTISRYAGNYLTEEGELNLEGIHSIKDTLYSCIGLFTSCLYVQRISAHKEARTFLQTLFWLLLLVIIPTNFDALLKPAEEGDAAKYIVGNKFTVGYYNLYLCFLYYFLHPCLNRIWQKITLFLLIVMMFVVCYHNRCGTMTIASLAFMYLALLSSNHIRYYLYTGKTIIVLLLIVDIGFFLLVSWLLQYDFFQYMITTVLGKDLTITGRTEIFVDIQQAFSISPWVGFGYGNSQVISKYFTEANDAQNGLIDMYIQIGFLGVLVFILMIHHISKIIEKQKTGNPIFAFIFTIIIISSVEIPFKFVFIFFLSFSFIRKMPSCQKK